MLENLRVYAEINLDNIKSNVEAIQKRVGEKTKIMAVIKADGYGHGSIPIARFLSREKLVYAFGVSTVREAVVLRKGGINEPILILGYVFPEDFETVLDNDITTTVFQYETALRLSEVAVSKGKKARIHIKIDTGMGRIGINSDDEQAVIDEIKKISSLENIVTEGIFTHFACADSADKTSANAQKEKFYRILDDIKQSGTDIPVRHMCNSAGIVEFDGEFLDMVRAGIIIYGLYPSDEVNRENIELKPAMAIKSRVVYVKTVKAGTPISYGSTYVTDTEKRIATISIGYADGIYRSLSSKGELIIKGKRVPIVGRICMDQCMVDVSEIDNISQGDIVTVIGKDGDEEITVEEISGKAGTFNYEFICGFQRRVPRVYTENGKIVKFLDYLEETI